MPPLDEQALADAIEQDSPEQEENLETEVEQEEQEQQEEVKLSALELEAQKMGHTSKEDFVAKGHDPEKWKTPHEYVSYGKLMSRLDKQNHKMDEMGDKFEARVGNLNKMHQQQLDAKVAALKVEQRNAVEDRDTDRFDAATKEIEDISKQVEDVADDKSNVSNKDPVTLAWEEKNPWINDANDPKTQMALGLWKGYKDANPNGTAQQALAYIDKQLEAMSPPQHNQRRDNVNTTERGNQTQRTKGKITSIKQLSPEWQQEWASTGFDIWGNNKEGKAAFIQAALDSEKG